MFTWLPGSAPHAAERRSVRSPRASTARNAPAAHRGRTLRRPGAAEITTLSNGTALCRCSWSVRRSHKSGTRHQAVRRKPRRRPSPRRSVTPVWPPRLPGGTSPGAPARACHRRRGFASSRNAAASQADPLGRSRPGTLSTGARTRESRPPPATRHPRSRQEPSTPRYGRPSLLGSAAPLRTDPNSSPASTQSALQAAPRSAPAP